MAQVRITVLGSYNTDLVTFTPRLPQPGETILGRGFKIGPGGKGSNQAVAAARLGAAVSFIGRVGQDMFGEMALDLWRQEGINTACVVRDPDHHTGEATILVDDAAENIIVVASGANFAITPTDVDRAEAVIAASDILLTQHEVPLPAVSRALELARKHGVRTILNPAPAQQLTSEILALVDVITPNQTEATIITGRPADDAESAARALCEKGAQTVVLTLGSRGVLLLDSGGVQQFPIFKVEPVDTTGAGDAFNGGLAVALAEGQPMADAIRFASATAAISVTRPGATDSMPKRAEVESLLRQA